MALEKQCKSCAIAEVNGGHCPGRENEGNERCPSRRDIAKQDSMIGTITWHETAVELPSDGDDGDFKECIVALNDVEESFVAYYHGAYG